MKLTTTLRNIVMLCGAVAVLAGTSASALADGKHRDRNTATPSASAPSDTNGRLLASNCFQCHGTNGSGGFERLAGSGEAYKELLEYANGGEDPDGIMAAHARGYTPAQLRAIADYLQRQ